jgi:predicted dithiol-disulfide oxidoreductase (DUF899 family)
MIYARTMQALEEKRLQIQELRNEMRALQLAVEPEEIADYALEGWEGPLRLSQLFGDKPNLILIFNMGRVCSSCTMWADGFNGIYDHLASRAAFVVCSPNSVEVQKAFAASRGWRFPMVSHEGSTFAEDLGFRHRGDDAFDERHGGWNPGVCTFRREPGRILRLSEADLGPLDDFCPYYHLMEMFPGGDPGFVPKYSYA